MLTELDLRTYQRQGVKFLSSRRYALLGDDVGLGKTAQALLAAGDSFPILIICTATIKRGWFNEINKWRANGKPRSIQIIESSKDVLRSNAEYYIINYDLVNRRDKKMFHALMGLRYRIIICDEAHWLKNTRSKRTTRILDPRGLISRTEKLWFLTATPIKNRPIDIFSLVASTCPEILAPYNTYLKFAYRYCGAFEDKYGLNVTGSSNELELANRLLPFMLRREQTQVLTELPKANINVIELECTEEAKKLIKEEEEKTLEIAGDRDLELLSLGETARIRQVLAEYKLKSSMSYVSDLLDETGKIIVFFHHKKVKAALLKKLVKQNPVFIDGSVKAKDRYAVIQKFRSDPSCRVLLGQIQACGEGVDGLQHVCHNCVFIEPSWSPTDITQCVGRLKRIGQKYMVNVYLLVIKSTLEAQMMGTARWKQKIMDKILNQKQEIKMHIEERLEKVENVLSTLVGLVDKLVSGGAAPAVQPTAAKTASKTTTTKTSTKAATKTATKPKTEPEPAPPSGVEPESEMTVDQVRALAKQICDKYPDGTGKNRCVAIVQSLGGTKLDTLKGEALEKCYQLFQDVLSESGDVDAI